MLDISPEERARRRAAAPPIEPIDFSRDPVYRALRAMEEAQVAPAVIARCVALTDTIDATCLPDDRSIVYDQLAALVREPTADHLMNVCAVLSYAQQRKASQSTTEATS